MYCLVNETSVIVQAGKIQHVTAFSLQTTAVWDERSGGTGEKGRSDCHYNGHILY